MADAEVYKTVLENQNGILSNVLEKQQEFRNAVNNKNWKNLMKIVSAVNSYMDEFNALDEKRDRISSRLSGEKTEECQMLVTQLKGKLVRCRAENKMLCKYLNITNNFVKGIVGSALPQSKGMLYSRNGRIVEQQPASLLFDTLS